MALVGKFVEEIMLQMQEKGFTQGEAELVPRFLERAIRENSKRFEYHKPFAVYRRINPDDNDQ